MPQTIDKHPLPASSFDIAIIGGGMVGASLAALLPSSFSIALIESFPLPSNANLDVQSIQPSFDNRATALSKSSQHFFERAGLWQTIAPFCEVIRDVHVSDKGYWGSVLLKEQDEPLDELGFVIENMALGQLIFSQITERNNIHCISLATVLDMQVLAEGVALTYQMKSNAVSIQSDVSNNTITAKLAIIADGANSSMCQKIGINIQHHDYQHTAIVTNLETSYAHKHIAYERFTDTGPMALLPLLKTEDATNRSALVWTLPSAEAKSVLALSDQEFLSELQQRFGSFQGDFLRVGKRFSYPLVLSSTSEQVRSHIVVMGNAAHSLHPVAGQGFNLALRDVECFIDTISQAQQENKAWNKLEVLEGYQQLQKNDQLLTTLFSDGLPQLFSNTVLPLAAGRNTGLLALELLPNLKSQFVNFATGYR